MTGTDNFWIPNIFNGFYMPQFNLAANYMNFGNYSFQYNNFYASDAFLTDFNPFVKGFNFNIPVLNFNASIFKPLPFLPAFDCINFQQTQQTLLYEQPKIANNEVKAEELTAKSETPEAEITNEKIETKKAEENPTQSYEPENVDSDAIVQAPAAPVQQVQHPKPENQRPVAGLDRNTYTAEEVLPGSYVHKIKSVNVRNLKPYMKEKLVKLSEKAEELGYTLVVRSGFRSHEEQIDLKRRKPNLAASPYKSAHEYGVAIDVGLFKDGKFVKDIYKEVPEFGEYGESIGLIWGARWRRPHEPWHFNMIDWKKLADVRDEYNRFNNIS